MNLKVASIETIKLENVQLKKRLDDVSNDVDQEKIGRNASEQYLRTSLNIKICGVPAQPGEDVQTSAASNPVSIEVVKQVCQQLNVLLPPPAIDVCHRLSNDSASPIIIRFTSKSARFNFVAQKSNFKGATSADVDLSGIQLPQQIRAVMEKRGPLGGTRGGFNGARSRRPEGAGIGGDPLSGAFGGGGFGEPTPIYLQEHLTKRNKDLLKEAKTNLRDSFRFPGYVYHGEIRAKKTQDSRHFVIRSSRDISNLVSAATTPTG